MFLDLILRETETLVAEKRAREKAAKED